jgi:hypothetical protein
MHTVLTEPGTLSYVVMTEEHQPQGEEGGWPDTASVEFALRAADGEAA